MQVKVAAVSSNRNSFGLREHVFISRTGDAFSGAANYLNEIAKGNVIMLDDRDPLGTLVRLGFELTRRLEPEAPETVINEVWG